MANSTTEEKLTDKSFTECCKQCGSGGSTKFSPKDLAITGCVAFVAGAIFVLLILFVIRLKRDKKLCFKEKEEPFKGKWEGASQKATIQVLKKHTLERSQENEISSNKDELNQEVANVSESEMSNVKSTELKNETETIETAEDKNQQLECAVEVTDVVENYDNEESNATQRKRSSEKDHKEDVEHEIAVFPTDISIESNKLSPTSSIENTSQLSHLYEKSRGSSVYEHEDLVLQNANFRISALSNI